MKFSLTSINNLRDGDRLQLFVRDELVRARFVRTTAYGHTVIECLDTATFWVLRGHPIRAGVLQVAHPEDLRWGWEDTLVDVMLPSAVGT